MSRAAGNVASDSDSSSAHSGKKFGHLHVIFRDWQAVSEGGLGYGCSRMDPAAAAVYHDLFDIEQGADAVEGASRNQIRRDILSSFETVDVWLFGKICSLNDIAGQSKLFINI